MKLYKIIATCSNYSGEGNPRELVFLPENFHGVKIEQKFNKQNPIGYTPKYSIETMRIIKGDKAWTDAIYDVYGLQSVVIYDVYKLNLTGTDYVLNFSFAIDFESYVKKNSYSEFALKSISCIDTYNKIKSSPMNFTGATKITLPTTQNYINYVSLKKVLGVSNGDNTGYLDFEQNEDAKIYNDDTAMYYQFRNCYEFGRGDSGTCDIAVRASGNLTIALNNSTSSTLYVRLCKNDNATVILTLGSVDFVGNSKILQFDFEKTIIRNFAFDDGDVLFVSVECLDSNMVITNILGEANVEVYVTTEVPANRYGLSIYHLTAESILNQLFGNDKTDIEAGLKTIGVTSAQSILKRLNYISMIPKDFITDFCAATGAVVNFNIDGTVSFSRQDTYFNSLLNKDNAIQITKFKDVEISYDETLNFASVTVGMPQKEYNVLTYLNDWNKTITFNQDREASENLNLALVKFRSDYSAIIDFINKLSSTSTDSSTDLIMFDTLFTERSTEDGIIYDNFTPRDILENWRKFLEFCFYNFSQDTLVLSSDGGDSFNLQINGVNQFDDFVFTGNGARILPLKIEFTCLIQNVDFAEKILTLNFKGTDIYIFVTEAQTTDKLIEQKVKGNLIFFAS
jgi:hypothetical protein